MRKKVLITVFIFSVFLNTLQAQFSSADSAFLNSIFTETVYQNDSLYPGTWYCHAPISSIPNLFSKLDSSFKFGQADWHGAYNNIQLENYQYDTILNSTFNYYYSNWGNAYLQYDPLIIQHFKLNGKTQAAYSTFTPTVNPNNCKTAYLIIPGSDNNKTTDLMLGIGYHNNNCTIKNNLKQFGDVYIHCKPLEDYRAIRWNGKKLNSADYVTPGANSYIYNYLNVQHTPYGLNYLIECVAILKMLKSKYDKVIVVGCSLGGYSALLAGLETPVDGVICASGYSIHFDNLASVQFGLTQNFDSLVFKYPSDTIKQRIYSQSSKRFLFSYADGDNFLYQIEHDSSFTQNFLNNPLNCSFYTNFLTHSFPPCSVLNDFSDSIISSTTVRFRKLQESNMNCVTRVNSCPGGVFNFYLQKDGVVLNSYFNVQDSLQLILTIPGAYTLTGITSGNQTVQCKDTIVYNPQLPTTASSLINQNGSCFVQNPVSNKLIVFSSKPERMHVEVFTIAGRVMGNYEIFPGEFIPCHQWTSGIYLLKIVQGGDIHNLKVLVNHDNH